MIRIVVVFPAPFGPSIPNISPGYTANVTSLTALVSPNDLAMCDTSTIFIVYQSFLLYNLQGFQNRKKTSLHNVCQDSVIKYNS
jgi:hypothetical protein